MHKLNIYGKEGKVEIKLDELAIDGVMEYKIVSSTKGLAELTLKLEVCVFKIVT